MNDASENFAIKRERLLQRELEVVQAAIERGASGQGTSRVPKDWSAKLQRWRDELETSLQRMPDRAA